MSALKDAILDAKYIDMIALADFVVTDCGLPDYDEAGNPLPQQNEVAAAIFRWAAKQETGTPATAALGNGAVSGKTGDVAAEGKD